MIYHLYDTIHTSRALVALVLALLAAFVTLGIAAWWKR